MPYVRTIFILLCITPGLSGEPPSYEARLADGTRVRGKTLGPWDEQQIVPTLDGQPWPVGNPPHWLNVAGQPDERWPAAFVEWVGGDRLAGEVVAWHSGAEQPFQRQPDSLVVATDRRLAAESRTQARVTTTSLRRIVWQQLATVTALPGQYEPGTAWLRSGRKLSFRAIRWEEQAVVLLGDADVERVPFVELAQLHLPPVDPWLAYTRQLAGLTCPDGARLVTVVLQDGSRWTASPARLRRQGSPASTAATLIFQPAWSLEAFRLATNDVRLWQSLSPQELPLSWFDPLAERQRHVFAPARPWRRDANVVGESLAGPDGRFAWGYGVHAHHELDFAIPDCARTVRTRFALEGRVREGGCVRAKLLVAGGPPDAKPAVLFESPPVLGSRQLVDSGTLALPAGARRRLTLVADMAHENRPAGADPFDIRDLGSWLEPLLILDAAALAAEVRQRSLELVPAWDGWTADPAAGAELLSRWSDPQQRFLLELRPAGATLALQRQFRLRPDDRFLMLFVSRQLHATNATRLRVLTGTTLLAELDVPLTQPNDDPDPLFVPLDKVAQTTSADPVLRLEQVAAGPRSYVTWHEVKLAPQRSGEARLWEGERRLLVTEPGVAAKESREVRLAVARIPRPGQFRYLRFAWRKQGGAQIRITLQAGEKQVTYQVGGPSSAGTPLEFPREWTSEIRDLFEDFGQRETTITQVTLEAPDGELALFDDLVAVRNLRDLDFSAPAHPLGDSPRQLKRGWGLEMHGEMIRQISPDFNTNSATRANTVTLFARYGGRTAVIENDSPQVFGLQLTVPVDLRTRLEATIGRRTTAWKLVVRVDGQSIHEQPVPPSPTPQWEDVSIDLTRFAGKTILLEPHGQGGGIWARLRVVSE